MYRYSADGGPLNFSLAHGTGTTSAGGWLHVPALHARCIVCGAALSNGLGMMQI